MQKKWDLNQSHWFHLPIHLNFFGPLLLLKLSLDLAVVENLLLIGHNFEPRASLAGAALHTQWLHSHFFPRVLCRRSFLDSSAAVNSSYDSAKHLLCQTRCKRIAVKFSIRKHPRAFSFSWGCQSYTCVRSPNGTRSMCPIWSSCAWWYSGWVPNFHFPCFRQEASQALERLIIVWSPDDPVSGAPPNHTSHLPSPSHQASGYSDKGPNGPAAHHMKMGLRYILITSTSTSISPSSLRLKWQVGCPKKHLFLNFAYTF